jgi:hypothetical protein
MAMEDYKSGRSYIPDLLLYVKAPPGFFLSIFSSLTCPKKPVFSKHDLLWWKVPARLEWNLLTNGRYQPASYYF